MELVRKFLLLLIVINTLDKIQLSSSSIPPSLANQVATTLTSCFADRLNPVIISDDLTDIVYKELTEVPVLVIDENFEAKSIRPYFNPRYPTYVLSVNSIKKLEATLKELATLSTWNVESIFIVVRYSEVDCDDDGRTILELLWNMDQLSAFYICNKSSKSLGGTQAMIYTVNPFSKRVPVPWKEVPYMRPIVKSQDQNKDNQPALFKRPYDNDPKLCLSLKFEKTKHLDGYPVKAVMDPSFKSRWNPNKTSKPGDLRDNLPYIHYKYFATLFSALNVTPIINSSHNVGNYTTDTIKNILNDIVNGTHDVYLNIKFITIPGYEFVDIVNPGFQNSHFILIHSSGAQKPIQSKLTLLNVTFALITVFVLIISYVIIIFNKIHNLNNVNNANDDDDDPEYANGFFDILRMIISTGILTPLNSTSMRFMFITSALLVFIVSPEMQGQLTSSSTKQEYSYPTSLKDLFDLKYNVTTSVVWRKVLLERKHEFNIDPSLLHSTTSHIDCYKRILKDPTVACMGYIPEQVEMAYKHDFPLLLIHELEAYQFFWSRKNWPLKKKVDSITMRLRETGFIEHWSDQSINLPLKKLRAKESSKPMSKYIPTEFDDLKLLYTCLASLSLGLSVFVFLIEVLTPKMKILRRQRQMKKKRQRLEVILRKFREENVNNRFLQDKVRIVRGRVVILP